VGGICINMLYPVDRWNECEGVSHRAGIHCSTAQALERWMGLSQLLGILALASMVFIHRSTAHTVTGGVTCPLLFQPLAEGARRTADLYIISVEHSAPGVGQGQLGGVQQEWGFLFRSC
jgi:hypothetical protein